MIAIRQKSTQKQLVAVLAPREGFEPPTKRLTAARYSVSAGFILYQRTSLYSLAILSVSSKRTTMKQKETSCNVSPNFIQIASQKLFWLATGLAGIYEIYR